MNLETRFHEQTGLIFEDFYKKYRPKLIWHLMRMSNDQSEAEEVTDDAFMKSLEKIGEYDREKSQFSTWLFTIAKNIMFQRIKDNKRYESIEEDHDGATIVDFLMANNEDRHTREYAAERKIQMLKNEMTNLPDMYAQVITMRTVDGLTYQEIADYLMLNLNTVKSQIRQGKILLKKELENDFEKLDKMSSDI
jgi:RNA polymerase sigma-70 factor, ECF subfamily